MKKNFKLFCFGFGQVANYFVKSLIKKNFSFDLVSTNTNKTQFRKIDNLKHISYFFNGDKFDEKLLEELDSSNKVLISIPPVNTTDIVTRIFKNKFEKNNFDWVTYLSATSVYGDKEGQWVNEELNLKPTSPKGVNRVNAEKKWLEFYEKFKLPIQIFRLSGIYSHENNIIKRLKAGTVKIVKKKDHFFSRIHVEDIAEVLTLSLNRFKSGQIYNISDDYPCSNEEITQYAAKIMQVQKPEAVSVENIKNEMLKNFYKDSKKVSNKKMKLFFDYKLKYPTFKEGLKVIRNHYI